MLSLAQTPVGSGTPRLRPRATALSHPPAALDALRDALLDALRSERKLLDELAATMRRQRTAVGTEDLQSVDDSVFATHRILATLGQARVRRRQINRLLVGVDELPARELESVLGNDMTDALRGARDDLQAAAGVLAREVDVNRRVLREALAHGDTHARVLVAAATGAEMPNGSPAPSGRYAPAPAGVPSPAGGVLINRTA
ncbi:MAG: flagellar export chaperone FlgN [Gemmatirosa sp.]|nr:flagellar export chaperone FlgN [Gemmatirosa sp.]